MKTPCSVIFVKCEFILNAVILILLITKSFKTKLNHGIVFVATVQYLPPQNLSLLLNQFNSLSDETNLNDDDVDKINNCKYYDVEQVQTLKIHKNSLKIFHINACSINKNFDDIEFLLKFTNINYNITAISKTRTMKNLEITQNINLKGYNFEYTPT